MASATANGSMVGTEDLLPVRSRISWGAVLAGAVLALAVYFLLTLLGGAIGLSVSDKFEGRNIGNAAAVYAIVATAGCLLLGGCVAAQLTTGENKMEAALYGLLVWAVFVSLLMWLVAAGVRTGFGAMAGVATAGSAVADRTAQNVSQADAEEAARKMGFTQQQIEEVKSRARNAPAEVGAAVQDPANRQRAEQAAREAGEVATRVTWWTFTGVLLSMGAAALGGVLGAGPTFRLFAVPSANRGGYVDRQPVRTAV